MAQFKIKVTQSLRERHFCIRDIEGNSQRRGNKRRDIVKIVVIVPVPSTYSKAGIACVPEEISNSR